MIKKVFLLSLLVFIAFNCNKNKHGKILSEPKIKLIKWNDTLIVRSAIQQGTTKNLAGYIRAVFTVKNNSQHIVKAYKAYKFTVGEGGLTLNKDKVTIKLIPIDDRTTNMLFDIKP